jgi:hypothetical protein
LFGKRANFWKSIRETRSGEIVLRSQFLLSLRAAFGAGGFGADLEFREDLSATVLKESLEVCLYISRQDLYLYQTLTVWGDQVAVFSVRENITKRLHKLLFKLEEFPLVLESERVVALFGQSAKQLLRLGFPSGESADDREVLVEVGSLWLEASSSSLH